MSVLQDNGRYSQFASLIEVRIKISSSQYLIMISKNNMKISLSFLNQNRKLAWEWIYSRRTDVIQSLFQVTML